MVYGEYQQCHSLVLYLIDLILIYIMVLINSTHELLQMDLIHISRFHSYGVIKGTLES